MPLPEVIQFLSDAECAASRVYAASGAPTDAGGQEEHSLALKILGLQERIETVTKVQPLLPLPRPVSLVHPPPRPYVPPSRYLEVGTHVQNNAGFRRLRRRGIEVATGVLDAECRRQHRGFISVHERKRPHVTLKLATSLDGRIALGSGESRWITSDPARNFVHRLRAEADAILVGSETARTDDPELTARRGARVLRRPIRLLLDGRLRVSPEARLYLPAGDSRTWVLCRKGARGITRIRERAQRVIELPSGVGRHVDLKSAMQRLAEEGLTTIFVEGGGGLAAALLRAQLVDEVHWLLAPKLIGSDGMPSLGPLELSRLSDAVELDVRSRRRLGPDLHLHAEIRSRSVRSRASKGKK